MATYVPNATQTTEPTEDKSVESAALEFRTLKTRVNDLETALEADDLADLRVPEASVAVLPAVAARAGKVLGFDAGGNPIVVEVAGATDPSLRSDLAASSGASLVGYLPAGTGAVATDVQTVLRETVSVTRFGAVGDGVTDDTAAVQLALNFSKNVTFPPTSSYYKLTNQLNPQAGSVIFAYGATLRWTSFGTSLAGSVAACAQTGNGIRLLNNTKLFGGTYQVAGVASPSDVSIPAASFSGAFWNIIAIGHFSTVTTTAPETPTSGIVIRDVKTETVSGSRYGGIFGAGYTHTITIENWEDESGAGVADYGMEFTWGSGALGDVWYPYNITLLNAKVRGVNLLAYEGVRFSGCYDVTVDKFTSINTQEALTFYVGDPGTNATYANGVQDVTLVGRGLKASNIYCEKFNIGIQILGDGNGSTHTDRKTNTVDLQLSDFTLIGNGKTNTSAPWTSNTGIYVNTASGYTIENGTIRECSEGGIVTTSSTGGAFTVPVDVRVDGVTIYNIGKDGTYFNYLVNAVINRLIVHHTNESGATPNASITLSNVTGTNISDCILGQVGDSTRVSVRTLNTCSNNNLIRTTTLEEAAGVYSLAGSDDLTIHGDCVDTGGATTSAARYSKVKAFLNFGASYGTAVLVAGVATLDGSNAYVDTEAAAAADDFTDIVIPNATAGDMILLTPASSSRTLNVRHAQGAAGTSTRTKSGATEAMTQGFTIFIYDGGDWFKSN